MIHIYGDDLNILPLKSVKISDRFIRGRVHSAQKPVELGGLLLRQRGLKLTFNLTEFKRGTQERLSDLSSKANAPPWDTSAAKSSVIHHAQIGRVTLPLGNR